MRAPFLFSFSSTWPLLWKQVNNSALLLTLAGLGPLTLSRAGLENRTVFCLFCYFSTFVLSFAFATLVHAFVSWYTWQWQGELKTQTLLDWKICNARQTMAMHARVSKRTRKNNDVWWSSVTAGASVHIMSRWKFVFFSLCIPVLLFSLGYHGVHAFEFDYTDRTRGPFQQWHVSSQCLTYSICHTWTIQSYPSQICFFSNVSQSFLGESWGCRWITLSLKIRCSYTSLSLLPRGITLAIYGVLTIHFHCYQGV